MRYNRSRASCTARGARRAPVGGCGMTAPLRARAQTVDDGSCVPRVSGCMQPSALNYDSPRATVTAPGGCVVTVEGCTDSTARNYGRLPPSRRRSPRGARLRVHARVAAALRLGRARRRRLVRLHHPWLLRSRRRQLSLRRDRGGAVRGQAARLHRPDGARTATPPPRPTTARARTFGSGAPTRRRRAPASTSSPPTPTRSPTLQLRGACTDSRATNYEAIATVDDGRCVLRRASVQVATFGYMQRGASSTATTTARSTPPRAVVAERRGDRLRVGDRVRRRRRGAARRRPRRRSTTRAPTR